MTYLNESEVDEEGYKTISFGGLDNSPNNAPQDYYITEEMVGLQLLFESLQLKALNNLVDSRLTIRRKSKCR